MMVELFGRGIGPSQGLCLHKTAQKMWTYIHASSGIRINDPSVQPVQDHTR